MNLASLFAGARYQVWTWHKLANISFTLECLQTVIDGCWLRPSDHAVNTGLSFSLPLCPHNFRTGFPASEQGEHSISRHGRLTELSLQQDGDLTWERRVLYNYSNMVKLEQNLDYSVRPPVIIWSSRPFAKSAYYWSNAVFQGVYAS